MGRIPIFLTFGNHMHWVDMEWLWGQDVLPGSVDDMLALCEATGAKGNVNFDGVGYEKLAAENPPAFARLRAAIEDGRIEVVGGSYGQPYGLFHGGESNVRQRVVGSRTIERLFGLRPRTFWEEEFDFFPQLPQMLQGAGFVFGSLFFQWTWHTPHVPFEEVPAVWWTSPDGSRLLSATRNRLNVHQWPEDFDGLLDGIEEGGEVPPLVLQWLELMPSPDWMCRSEVLLPRLRELLDDPRFEIRRATLGEYLAQWEGREVPVRAYPMHEVFHGMSLGKNGDDMRHLSARGEGALLTAEALASVASVFGRPYAQWDVYPFWELEEGWRELLQAQHHDNDECEGLCGHVGRFSYARSESLAAHVEDRCLRRLAAVAASGPGTVFFNPLGWRRSDTWAPPAAQTPIVVRDLPPFGFRFVPDGSEERKGPAWTLEGAAARGRRGDLAVEVEAERGTVLLTCPEWPEGIGLAGPLGLASAGLGEAFVPVGARIDELSGDLVVDLEHPCGGFAEAWLKLPGDCRALDLTFRFRGMPRPLPGMTKGLEMRLAIGQELEALMADTPYLVQEVQPGGAFLRKYPEGDWMTSPQWFETVEGGFTAATLVDMTSGSRGLTIAQDRTRQWFGRDGGLACLLTMADPWDEDYFVTEFDAAFRFVPHRGVDRAQKWQWGQEFQRPVVAIRVAEGRAEAAIREFAFLTCEADSPFGGSASGVGRASVQVTALYREARGAGMEHPFVVRLVEMDGSPAEVRLRFSGTIVRAVRTNLLGDPSEELVLAGDGFGLSMRGHEIATVYVEIAEGRKVTRDLDAHREVWATIHRV